MGEKQLELFIIHQAINLKVKKAKNGKVIFDTSQNMKFDICEISLLFCDHA